MFCCFRSRASSFYSQLKRVVEPRKIFIMPGYDLRKSCPLSSQSEPAYYCIHIIKHGNDCQWEPYYINLRDEYQKIVFSCKRKKLSGKSIYQRLRLRETIDLRGHWKYHIFNYFAIVEFNNCFIIRSPRLFSSYKSVKTVTCSHEQNIIYSKRHLDVIVPLRISLRWPIIQIINPVDKTKLSCRPYHKWADHYMHTVFFMYRSWWTLSQGKGRNQLDWNHPFVCCSNRSRSAD